MEDLLAMNKLRIVFIHGIAPTVINWDFSERLSGQIKRKLMDYGVIPEGATAEEIDEIITFDRVNYSMIGDDAQLRLLQAYEQETAKLYNFVYRLNSVAGLDKIRRQIITSVSDVMVYKSDYWKGEIQQMVLDKLDPYIGSGDSVSIIAHSLGSVVAFDTLHENVNKKPEWVAAGYRPTNLFTMGSPIALFTLDLNREFGTPGSPDDPEWQRRQLVQPDGVWYNFLDAQDLIAYPLEILFQDKFTLQDIVVQTGTNPRKAHDGYWDNDEVTDFVAGRLKLDFQRINIVPSDGAAPAAPEPASAATNGEEPVDEHFLKRLLDI
jgi:hypothetical protein